MLMLWLACINPVWNYVLDAVAITDCCPCNASVVWIADNLQVENRIESVSGITERNSFQWRRIGEETVFCCRCVTEVEDIVRPWRKVDTEDVPSLANAQKVDHFRVVDENHLIAPMHLPQLRLRIGKAARQYIWRYTEPGQGEFDEAVEGLYD